MNPNQERIESLVYKTVLRACTEISEDVLQILEQAYERETNPTAQSMLAAMLDNVRIAGEKDKGICQSPGYPTSWLSFGDFNMPLGVACAVERAVVDATKKGYLRPSLVDAVTRHNDGTNTGLGIPNIEYEYNPGQTYIDFIISFKGCGAELGNAMQITVSYTHLTLPTNSRV